MRIVDILSEVPPLSQTIIISIADRLSVTTVRPPLPDKAASCSCLLSAVNLLNAVCLSANCQAAACILHSSFQWCAHTPSGCSLPSLQERSRAASKSSLSRCRRWRCSFASWICCCACFHPAGSVRSRARSTARMTWRQPDAELQPHASFRQDSIVLSCHPYGLGFHFPITVSEAAHPRAAKNMLPAQQHLSSVATLSASDCGLCQSAVVILRTA